MAIIVGLTAFGLIVSFSVARAVQDPIASPWPLATKLGSILGATFGLAAGLCWLVTFSRPPMMRLALRILIVAVFGFVLSLFRVSGWLQHALNLAGLVIFQSIWFAWLGVPSWAKSGLEIESLSRSPKQFQVADLLAMTAAAACWLGLVTRFAIPAPAEIDLRGMVTRSATPAPASIYWIGLLTIWAGGPLVAACFVLASLARSLSQAVQQLLLGVCLVGLMSLALSLAQSFVTGNGVIGQLTVPSFYAMFFWTFGVTLLGMGFAGRFQAIWLEAEPDESAAGPTVE